MHFRTILLIATGEQSLRSQLAIAMKLAARSETHLVGLAILPPRIIVPAGTPGAPDTASIEVHRDTYRREAERMRVTFELATSGQINVSSEWILEDADDVPLMPLIAAHSRSADLVISGRTCKHGARAIATGHFPENIVIHSGRPVLLVPKVASDADFGDRVVVAWNGAREASRAAFDAIPILKWARHVKVLRVGVKTDAQRLDRLSIAKLCGTLARHNIQSEDEDISLPDSDVGPALLSAVKAENADLLVMGCYGHSRLRELVLGGATRHVLEHMTVPVLMSH